ncbi:MAG: flippase-like domain-containing protein [Ignavibacteriaceae bacterium]|nr:flippase-like domain-containing protein [Ignavibacteriaceae bacterium]
MIEKTKKRILISLVFAGLIYLGFTVYGDFERLVEAFSAFPWYIYPLLLVLSSVNYIFRFVKWDYYLRIVGVTISKGDSFGIFMSGLIMSITPGKFGEVLKAYLVKQIDGTPISKTTPIIFVERITDFLSLILITLLGAFLFDYGRGIISAVGLFFVVVIILISNRGWALEVLNQLHKIRLIQKLSDPIQNAYESSYQLLRPLPLFYMTGISLFSWIFECLGYYIILINFNLDISIIWASFAYGFATIVGAITMMPGGLGVTEGSLTFLAMDVGASKEVAVAATFIIRAVTLWFAVLVGVIAVSVYQRKIGKEIE